MKTIWKFPLEMGANSITMPRAAKILTVAAQYDELQMWALVDPDAPREDRVFFVLGTGQNLPEKISASFWDRYIGTCQLMDGALVVHVFESP